MITELWIMGSLWDCLSLEQENTGYLKIWIRVSELSRTWAHKPVPGRQTGRQEVTWQNCHRLWGQQAQCWSRWWAGLPPLNPNVLLVWWKRAWAIPEGTFFSFFLFIWDFICLFQGCCLFFCPCTTEWKVCHFCPMDEPQQYYERWKSTVWFYIYANQN